MHRIPLAIPALVAALVLLVSLPAQSRHYTARNIEPRDQESPAVTGGRFWDLPPGELQGLRWPASSEAIEHHVEHLLASMSDEERVAQILMLTWSGEEPNEEFLRWITERNLGGVKIFGWNAENLVTLTNTLTAMQRKSIATSNGIPLFTATDQEGGWVRHIRGETLITPGNMAIGASGLPYDAMMSSRYIGQELRALGVNMNFAPTVDVYINPEAHVIGPRAFSNDASQTGLLGLAFFRGHEQSGVIATAKHFPGHGNATGDSHGVLPVLKDSFETLWDRDLLPFRMLIREGIPAILGGHLSFPEISGAETPASLSRYFNITLLRETLGFEGIVITDDMYMGGALVYAERQGWTFAELIKQAILAGNDSVMLSRTPAFDGLIWRTLLEAYREEPEFRRRVDESVRRTLRVKIAYLIPEWRVPLFPDASIVQEFVRIPEARTFFLDQAGRSITMIRDTDLPHPHQQGERVLLAGRGATFFAVGREFFPGADELRFQGSNFYTSLAEDRHRWAAAMDRYDTVIFLLSDPNTLEILQSARPQNAKVIVYSVLTPIYLGALPWVENAIAVYGWARESFEAGFSVIQGHYEPRGSLPLLLNYP
ncbi:glycosyl hydrolase [Alkalispirochaeta sphaeroplastigenens]|uniref:beta-N-acetylhexosaminidase n=1 Tax=Alkalispirochaeta sphaeroplastigenens TaxID=1187066 RepID=A0A2S4K089_9SPIO|nr:MULTISPECIES: glycoside hydrolase family 3 N-terminal domain-containing protein [Alkalispirochaeta]POR05185.1 glycosyl hydrolase [Alkalispirochaeta sphaeroplastigenens]